MTGEPADLEYVGLMALARDALRGDTSGWEDRAWFLQLVRERPAGRSSVWRSEVG